MTFALRQVITGGCDITNHYGSAAGSRIAAIICSCPCSGHAVCYRTGAWSSNIRQKLLSHLDHKYRWLWRCQTGVAGQLIGVVSLAHVMTGGVMSRTTMVLLQVAVLPQSSVAVHVLVTL